MTYIPHGEVTDLSRVDAYRGYAEATVPGAEPWVLTFPVNNKVRFIRILWQWYTNGGGYLNLESVFGYGESSIDAANWGVGQYHYVHRMDMLYKYAGHNESRYTSPSTGDPTVNVLVRSTPVYFAYSLSRDDAVRLAAYTPLYNSSADFTARVTFRTPALFSGTTPTAFCNAIVLVYKVA